MTDSKVFLDTSPIIYLLDNDENYGSKTRDILSLLAKENRQLITSVITCTEYLVVPYRTKNQALIAAFWELVEDCSMPLCPVTKTIAQKAAEIRAEYHFKTMDSLQIAVATMEHCDLFLTNDKELRRFEEIPCVTVEEWSF